MSELCGWTGTILRVNLTSGEVKKEALNEEWAREYVGGRGVAARYLYEEVDAQVDAYSEDNKLIFATGPLTGTNASCATRLLDLPQRRKTHPATDACSHDCRPAIPRGQGDQLTTSRSLLCWSLLP